ncbi:MAG: hypothetical protein ACP5MB_06410 [bacterium]
MFGITSAVFLNDLIIWLFAASADVTVGTIMYKMLLHKWWWQKDVKQPWSFSIGNNGWSFSAQDFNPMETFKKLYNDITGKNKGLNEVISNQVRTEVQKKVEEAIKRNVEEINIDPKVKEAIKTALENIFK